MAYLIGGMSQDKIQNRCVSRGVEGGGGSGGKRARRTLQILCALKKQRFAITQQRMAHGVDGSQPFAARNQRRGTSVHCMSKERLRKRIKANLSRHTLSTAVCVLSIKRWYEYIRIVTGASIEGQHECWQLATIVNPKTSPSTLRLRVSIHMTHGRADSHGHWGRWECSSQGMASLNVFSGLMREVLDQREMHNPIDVKRNVRCDLLQKALERERRTRSEIELLGRDYCAGSLSLLYRTDRQSGILCLQHICVCAYFLTHLI